MKYALLISLTILASCSSTMPKKTEKKKYNNSQIQRTIHEVLREDRLQGRETVFLV